MDEVRVGGQMKLYTELVRDMQLRTEQPQIPMSQEKRMLRQLRTSYSMISHNANRSNAYIQPPSLLLQPSQHIQHVLPISPRP